MAQDSPKMAPRWPKMGPRWPPKRTKIAQNGPTWKNIVDVEAEKPILQKCPKTFVKSLFLNGYGRPRPPKMRPRWAQVGRRWPQDGPRWPKMAPRWPQDGPKFGQDGHKMTQDCPRWPHDCSIWHFLHVRPSKKSKTRVSARF